MKKLLSLFLSLCIVGTMLAGLTLPAAAEEVNATSTTDGEITYEDLFYSYPHYLDDMHNLYLLTNKKDTWGATVDITSEYVYTSHFEASCIVHGISVAISPTELWKNISDTIGTTNFAFNDELDSANQKFIEAICNVELSASQDIGGDNKYVKSLNSFVKVAKGINKILLEQEAELNKLDKPEIYSDFLDRTIALLEQECTTGVKAKLPSLKSEMHTALGQSSKILGYASDAAEFMQALSLSVLMQQAQLDLIDEIIATQPSTSTLYQGMTRLKSQLSDGFVGYFSTTYIEDKVFDKIIDTISDKIGDWILGSTASYMSVLSSAVKIINNLVFKEILGFDYSEYTSAIMLQSYAQELYNSVNEKALSFSGDFAYEDIEKFEMLYNAYVAMRKAAFEECKNLAKHNDKYNTAYVIEKEESGVFDTENAFIKYLDAVIAHIKALPQENIIETDRSQGWLYTISNGEVTITGHENPRYTLLIPSRIKGYPVTRIENRAFYDGAIYENYIEEIVIPNSVTIIGESAFQSCDYLTKVIIGNSVTSIGKFAFSGCQNLKEIAIPDSVTYIGDCAFEACIRLTSVTIGNSVTNIGRSVFENCGFSNIEIPNNVKNIGNSAFLGCDNLTNINIPDSVVNIASEAFFDCNNVISITIGKGLASIGSHAFACCEEVSNIIVDSNNEVYDSRNDCDAIIETDTNTLVIGCKDTIIPDNVTSIDEYAFYDCENLTNIIIPNGVTRIGALAFYNCYNLTSIKLPDSVTRIDGAAFRNCSNLENIEMSDNITDIGYEAFFATKISNIKIPSGLINIDKSVFSACHSLTSVEIPNGVTSIGYGAFSYCSQLESVYIPKSVTSIGQYAFRGCDSLTDIYYAGSDKDWKNIQIGREFAPDNARIHYLEQHEHNYISLETLPTCTQSGYTIYTCSTCGDSYTANQVEALGHRYNAAVTYPTCVTNGYTTYTCEVCEYSYVSDKIEAVGHNFIDEVCQKCGDSVWNYVLINNQIIIIGHANPIGKITIPSSINGYSVIGIADLAFSGSKISSIEIPNGVVSIGCGAFEKCTVLTSVEIPSSVTNILEKAFASCYRLREINYTGTEESWNKISIGLDAIPYTATIYYLGDKHNYESIVTYPTCTKAGYTTYTCSICGDSYTADQVAALGHSYVVLEKAASCTEDGYKITTCKTCDYYNEIIYKGGHNYVDDVCQYCGDSLWQYSIADNQVTITGHSNPVGELKIPSQINGYPVTKIGNMAFQSSGVKSVIVPIGVKSIGNYAFYGCYNLENIELPKGLNEIGFAAFGWCESLTSITIPEGITTLNNIFNDCQNLKTIVLPNTLVTIGNCAFESCGVKNLIIPDSVITIDDGAFFCAPSLETINIPKSVTYIGDNAFQWCWSLESIIVDENNSKYSSQDGVLFNKDKTELIVFPCGKTADNYMVPNSVEIIGDYAFEACENVSKIVILDGVTSIGSFAFSGCSSLTSIIIPNSVNSIGDWAFDYCNSLEMIYYCGTNEEWNEISISDGNENLTDATRYYHNYDNACDTSCNICGEIRGVSHNYESVVTAPTATTQGYTTYTCTVCGSSYKGNYTDATGTVNGVQNMQIVATDTNIVVTWDTPKNISKYNLYVKNENGETIITRELASDKTSVTLSWPSELEWDKNYTIGIRAKTTKWLDTVWKDAALVVGNRIVDVKTQSVGRTIKVTWKAFDGATTYYVYVYKKGAYSEGAITNVKATTNSATIINAINPEIDYEVRVIATKGVPKMATADALSINARLNVFTPDTFTERGITPTKVGIGFDEVRGADKYWVYLTPVSGGAEIIKESTKAIAAVAGLAPNTAYTVQIQARITDADGKTHYSGKSAVLGTITTNGWEDINFTVTTTSSGAELTWDIPENAYSYIIYRSTNGGKSYKKHATISDPAQASYVDTKAKSGYKYAIVTQIQDDFVTAKSALIKP